MLALPQHYLPHTHAKENIMNNTIAAPGKAARIARVLALSGLTLAIACGFAELLAGLGYRWGWWHFRTGLQVMRWAANEFALTPKASHTTIAPPASSAIVCVGSCASLAVP